MIERMKYPDKKNAKSVLDASKKKMNYTLTLESTNDSAFNIIRNVCECFRMLGDALMISQGKISTDHVEQVKALERFEIKLNRPIQLIDNLRRIRHNINYYGFNPRKIDADDAISFSKNCFFKLAKAIDGRLK